MKIIPTKSKIQFQNCILYLKQITFTVLKCKMKIQSELFGSDSECQITILYVPCTGQFLKLETKTLKS